MEPVIRALAEAFFPALDASDCGPEVALYNRLSGADQPQVVTHVSWLGCDLSLCGISPGASTISRKLPTYACMHACMQTDSRLVRWSGLQQLWGHPYQPSLTPHLQMHELHSSAVEKLWRGVHAAWQREDPPEFTHLCPVCVVLLCMQVLDIIDNQLYGPSQAKLKM